MIVRGLKGSEVLHLVDGFRLNNAIFRNAPNQYMALVDSQMLDALEVVRGPMSTLYGGDAMGGVVQLLSRTPRFGGADPQAEGGLRAVWSSADRGLLSRAEGAAGHETLAISGGLTYQDVGALRIGGGERLPFTAFTARGGNAKLTAAPAEGHELMLQAQYFEQPDTPRHDELVPGFGQSTPNSAEFRFAPQVRRFTQARWRASGLGLLDGLDVQAGRQVIRDDRTTRDFGTVNRDAERNTVTTDGWSIKADRLWRENRYLTLGLEDIATRCDRRARAPTSRAAPYRTGPLASPTVRPCASSARMRPRTGRSRRPSTCSTGCAGAASRPFCRRPPAASACASRTTTSRATSASTTR